MVLKNKSIECTVQECKHHAKIDHYCSLPNIQITKHADKATNTEITDCGSFEIDHHAYI
ncbi:DUF1540 domain-containing protein [Bacillota bacterium LX-D]|nr:DUF1540 domain-containing protein [Bacillota bacterium LX-D]